MSRGMCTARLLTMCAAQCAQCESYRHVTYSFVRCCGGVYCLRLVIYHFTSSSAALRANATASDCALCGGAGTPRLVRNRTVSRSRVRLKFFCSFRSISVSYCSSEGAIVDLLLRFYNDRATPKLCHVDDIHTITGVIKRCVYSLFFFTVHLSQLSDDARLAAHSTIVLADIRHIGGDDGAWR